MKPSAARRVLDGAQDGRAEPQAAALGIDPHPLHFGGDRSDAAIGAARARHVVHVGDEERTVAVLHVGGVDVDVADAAVGLGGDELVVEAVQDRSHVWVVQGSAQDLGGHAPILDPHLLCASGTYATVA